VNVQHTVREFEAAGVAAIHIEDQVAPKRCGHLPGSRPVVDMNEQVGKIEAAVAARRDPDFMIIARTDAASGLGLDEAIRRGQAYRSAGADIVFVELKSSPRIVEELTRVTAEIDAPCLVNVEELGELGQLTASALDAIGLRLAIYPGLARYAAGYGIREALGALKRDGTTRAARERMLTFKEYNAALGISDVEEWEKRFLMR
jgi:2-methylisocitrate lyase-like PEP mutase family enzyme